MCKWAALELPGIRPSSSNRRLVDPLLVSCPGQGPAKSLIVSLPTLPHVAQKYMEKLGLTAKR